jgi:hypothetical protein
MFLIDLLLLTLSDETGASSFGEVDIRGADLSIFLFFDGTIGSRLSRGCVVITSDTASVLTEAFLAFSLAFCFARLAWRAAAFAF